MKGYSLVLIQLAAGAIAAANYRGVPALKLADYKKLTSNGKWACLSNPEIEIDVEKINDNYCDCPDGSDEPGTSACSNGKFFCENAGFKSSYIPSFKVNDGICDYDLCCDGSDEWDTDAKCENKCKEFNKQYLETKAANEKKLSLGLAVKAKLLASAKNANLEINKQVEKASKEASYLNDELYQLTKQLKESNSKYNKDAVDFLTGLEQKQNITRVDDFMEDIVKNIKLIRVGAAANNEKIGLAQALLRDLSENFDQSINDVTVKENIERFKELENDEKHKDYAKLQDSYLEEYNATLKDLKLYNVNFWLKANEMHFAKWKDFVWTRKSQLHKRLLEFLLVQDDLTKKLEAIMDDVKQNYNPNFNNDEVKLSLKKIGEYDELKKKHQEEILSKIDYGKQYEEGVKHFLELIEDIQRNIDRTPFPINVLNIDTRTEEELDELRKKEEAEIAEKAKSKEENQGTGILSRVHKYYVDAIEDFLGINDNLPDTASPLKGKVGFDYLSVRMDDINDLSNGNEEGSKELKELKDAISSKQEKVLQLNSEVEESVNELSNEARYGPDRILKAVENEVYKRTIGEYEYSINLMGDLRQIGNGNDVLIGRYNGEFHLRDTKAGKKVELNFDNGQRCWSGPVRNAKLNIYCGDRVDILKVTEPEVCQYYIDLVSPIACFGDEEAVKQIEHDEL